MLRMSVVPDFETPDIQKICHLVNLTVIVHGAGTQGLDAIVSFVSDKVCDSFTNLCLIYSKGICDDLLTTPGKCNDDMFILQSPNRESQKFSTPTSSVIPTRCSVGELIRQWSGISVADNGSLLGPGSWHYRNHVIVWDRIWART